MKRLLLALLLLSPVIAYDAYGYGAADAADSFKVFVSTFSNELASLSMAAVSAVGLQLALKRFMKSELDARSINTITLSLFIATFLLIYGSGMYELFVPFIGYVMVVGFGIILWAVYKGMADAKLEPFDKLFASFGLFALSWLSFRIGLLFLSVVLSVFGLILLLASFPRFNELFGKKKPDEGGDSDDAVIVDKAIDEAADKLKVTADNFDGLLDSVKADMGSMVSLISDARTNLNKLLQELKP